ncbi:MAG TPA: NUDIX domain-containing protein [Terriglobales bacterium]|nr:NUDIX domain-containing protein [Terriglobales bacterium]
MVREISAGGVVLRKISDAWHVALIEPQREKSEASSSAKRTRAVLALPKGLLDSGEKAQDAAIREVREETGITAEVITKLADIKYVYVRTWGDGERVFKIVSFYLLRYSSGEIDAIAPEMRIEVKRALWVPLAETSRQLAYGNERKVLHQAQEFVENHADLVEATAGKPGKRDGAGSHTDM